MSPVIPAPVPVPLPAPPWLVQLLLLFTWVLHVLAMNLLVGGALILAASTYLGRRDRRHRELARRAARVLPAVVASTITFGVAPLLFVQLLYGQLFYTSSVLMAWSWLAVVLFLLVAYYGIYWFNFQQETLGTRAFWVMLLTALFLLHIMMTFTQNLSLMQRPQDFYARFLQTAVGNYLGSFDVETMARFAHFLVAAIAVAGLGLALLAQAWREEAPELAAWARGYGAKWFMSSTGIEFLVGLGFLFSLPPEIRSLFLGGDRLASAILAVAVVLAVVALAAASRSPAASAVAIIGTVSLMAVVRHLLRIAYLRPYFDPRALPVQGQWAVFALFAVLLLAGGSVLGWMLYKFFCPTSARSTSV